MDWTEEGGENLLLQCTCEVVEDKLPFVASYILEAGEGVAIESYKDGGWVGGNGTNCNTLAPSLVADSVTTLLVVGHYNAYKSHWQQLFIIV